MSVADDHGRFYGNPITIRAACWPRCPERVSEADICSWLNECSAGAKPLLSIYEADDSKFLQLHRFRQQIRSKSKFPECLSTVNHEISECEANAQPSRIRIRISESYKKEGNSLISEYQSFLQKWETPIDSGKVFPILQADLGLQIWMSLIDSGKITAETLLQVFAGLERWRGSAQWKKGMVHSIPTWLGWSKNGMVGAPMWNDKPEQAAPESEY